MNISKIGILLSLLALYGCQSVTITTPDGTKIKSLNTGDFGNIAATDSTGSAGGLTSLIAGNVNTTRGSQFVETEPGYMRTTAGGVVVEFGGVINNSTVTARHWDGITSSIRNWVARLVAKDLFNVANNNINQKEQTTRNASNNAVKETQIQNAARVETTAIEKAAEVTIKTAE